MATLNGNQSARFGCPINGLGKEVGRRELEEDF